MHACMHVCKYIYVCMHACMYVCMHVCMHLYMYVCMCVLHSANCACVSTLTGVDARGQRVRETRERERHYTLSLCPPGAISLSRARARALSLPPPFLSFFLSLSLSLLPLPLTILRQCGAQVRTKCLLYKVFSTPIYNRVMFSIECVVSSIESVLYTDYSRVMYRSGPCAHT